MGCEVLDDVENRKVGICGFILDAIVKLDWERSMRRVWILVEKNTIETGVRLGH